MKWEILMMVVLIGSVLGCAGHTMTRQILQSNSKLSEDAVFYIAVNKDGVFAGEQYPETGKMFSKLIQKELAKEAYNIEIGKAYETYDHALVYAQEKGKDYLIYPEILHWENQISSRRRIPDKVNARIKIIEVATGQILDQMVFESKKSKMALGGHPQDLLVYPIREYIELLF